jgi:hypothetical protein
VLNVEISIVLVNTNTNDNNNTKETHISMIQSFFYYVLLVVMTKANVII